MTPSEHSTEHPAGRSIILIGPVGAGKTSVGHALADHLGLPFVHVDDMAATQLGASIAHAMINQPDECEALQRSIALHWVGECTQGSPSIVAIPPAASTFPAVTEAISEARAHGALVVELTVDVAELARRLGLNGPRTVQLGAPRAMLARMLTTTHEHHAQLADVSVTTVGQSIEQVLQEILAAL